MPQRIFMSNIKSYAHFATSTAHRRQPADNTVAILHKYSETAVYSCINDNKHRLSASQKYDNSGQESILRGNRENPTSRITVRHSTAYDFPQFRNLIITY